MSGDSATALHAPLQEVYMKTYGNISPEQWWQVWAKIRDRVIKYYENRCHDNAEDVVSQTLIVCTEKWGTRQFKFVIVDGAARYVISVARKVAIDVLGYLSRRASGATVNT